MTDSTELSPADQLRAAKVAARHATSAEDLRALLLMLGLLVDDKPEPIAQPVMARCDRCGQDKPGKPRRGMCRSCYSTTRSRALACGRWEPERVSAFEALARLDALVGSGMGMLQIRRMADLPQTTLANFAKNRPQQAGLALVDGMLSVPIPGCAGEWIAAAQGQEIVPSLGASRRLRALIAAGWPANCLGGELGVLPPAVSQIIHERMRIRAHRHHEVATLFGRLQLVPGPSDAARAYGRSRGWRLPLQWEEASLDEIDGRPEPGSRRHQRRAVA